MNTKHISLAFAAAATLLCGCTKNTIEKTEGPDTLKDLELASIRSTETKTAIDGTSFPKDGKIGLFLFKDEKAEIAYADGCANVNYSYNEGSAKWTANPAIKVGDNAGYLYGYYPYDSKATDIKTIPVKSSLNGDDVMFATKQTVTSSTASRTAITMNHALARVSITLVKKGYSGDAKLTEIKFSGAEVASTGTLNALEGSISATKSEVTLDVTGDAQTITADGTTYECLLVPSAEISDKQTVELTLTIDGIDKEVTLSGENGVIIAQSTQSSITLTVTLNGNVTSSFLDGGFLPDYD